MCVLVCTANRVLKIYTGNSLRLDVKKFCYRIAFYNNALKTTWLNVGKKVGLSGLTKCQLPQLKHNRIGR